MPPPKDMGYWLAQKYGIAKQEAEGGYQRNIAKAKLRTQQALTEQSTREFFNDPDRVDLLHDTLLKRDAVPIHGPQGAPDTQAPQGAPGTQAPQGAPGTQAPQGAPSTTTKPRVGPTTGPTQLPLPPLLRPLGPNWYTNPQLPWPSTPNTNPLQRPDPYQLDPNQPLLPIKPRD